MYKVAFESFQFEITKKTICRHIEQSQLFVTRHSTVYGESYTNIEHESEIHIACVPTQFSNRTCFLPLHREIKFTRSSEIGINASVLFY